MRKMVSAISAAGGGMQDDLRAADRSADGSDPTNPAAVVGSAASVPTESRVDRARAALESSRAARETLSAALAAWVPPR